jgi:hypothetical protein
MFFAIFGFFLKIYQNMGQKLGSNKEQSGLDFLLGEVARQTKQVRDFPPICTYTI